MKQKCYKVPLNPTPWTRAGYNGRTRKFYDGQLNIKAINLIYLLRDHGEEPPFTQACHVDITFIMQRTKNNKLVHHDRLPDLDNLIKFILDTMTPDVLVNDKIVTSINAIKKYEPEPMTLITVTEIE